MNNGCSDNPKKRKRSKNTTTQQYEIYLEAMENDYVFRSNTINPSLPPNYIEKKWDELITQLNGVGNGPALTAEEWKKRFLDWKYATKAKSRKIRDHHYKTGGGPKTESKLSNLEERALNVWGRVTVEGAKVTTYEGITRDNDELTGREDSIDDRLQNTADSVDDLAEEEVLQTIYVVNETANSTVGTRNRNQSEVNIQGTTKAPTRPRPKPLSVLAENLLTCTEKSSANQNELLSLFKEFSANYLELERQKLNFEILKFQFLNPGFEIGDDNN